VDESSFPQPTSSPWLSTLIYHPGMNNMPVGGHCSETSDLIDMINESNNIISDTTKN
jgi:hypothetical protein